MSNTRLQRIIAVLILISPWIYIPLVFKEVLFIGLAFMLYLSTVELKRKKEGDNEYNPGINLADNQTRETLA